MQPSRTKTPKRTKRPTSSSSATAEKTDRTFKLSLQPLEGPPISRTITPKPTTYAELQCAFVRAFPKFSRHVVMETSSGRTLMPSSKFQKVWKVTAREIPMETPHFQYPHNIPRLGLHWEDTVYEEETKGFDVRLF